MLGAAGIAAGIAYSQHRSPWAAVLSPFVPPPETLFHKDHLLVLLEGLDYDYNPQDEESSKRSRSDVIKAINLDFITHNAYVIDVPRDMDAILPTGRETKINEAQSEGGVREAQSVIAGWLGIPGFDRYVILRINATKDLINALGGVDVKVMNSDCITHPHGCVNGPLDYDDTWGHLAIHLKPGFQHLTGEQAVGYGRFRHDWCGDPCRIQRQDQIVTAIIAKLRDDKINTLLHVNDLLGVVSRDVETNLNRAEELSLALAFADMPQHGLHIAQVPYVDDKIAADGGQVLIPDLVKKARLVQSMLVAPQRPQTIASIGQLSVSVENGTGVPGMARRVAQILQGKGFMIGEIGTAANSIATTQVRDHSAQQNAGARVRDALGSAASGAMVVADVSPPQGAAVHSDVTVIVGQDLVPALTAQTVSH